MPEIKHHSIGVVYSFLLKYYSTKYEQTTLKVTQFLIVYLDNFTSGAGRIKICIDKENSTSTD